MFPMRQLFPSSSSSNRPLHQPPIPPLLILSFAHLLPLSAAPSATLAPSGERKDLHTPRDKASCIHPPSAETPACVEHQRLIHTHIAHTLLLPRNTCPLFLFPLASVAVFSSPASVPSLFPSAPSLNGGRRHSLSRHFPFFTYYWTHLHHLALARFCSCAGSSSVCPPGRASLARALSLVLALPIV